MKAELEKLIALQNLDINIRRLESELQTIPERRAIIENEFEQRAFEIKTLENSRDLAHETRIRTEGEIAQTQMQAERAERNLMSSTGEKDYGASIREIDATRKHLSQLETQLLEKMEEIETIEAALAEREPEIKRLRIELAAKVQVFETELKDESEELESCRIERERVLSALPKQMVTLYNRIMARIPNGIAVAEARNGLCTACFMALRPQVMAEVRRNEEVITCDNCGRILFFTPVEALDAATPAVSAMPTTQSPAASVQS